VAALTSASFTSSVVTTLDSWRAFINHDPRKVTLLTGEQLDRLTEGERRVYDDMRADYHAELPALPHWAALAVPAPDRRHRLFYQRLLTELDVGDSPLRTMRTFDPLPRDIQEQARWGRLLSDPDWGAPPPAVSTANVIPFIDITDNYERAFRL
jgi:hypothetical protein